MKLPISVTIITQNEEKNIASAIRSVEWADEIIVVDSGSTDRTIEMARALGAKVTHHSWQGYGQQKNFAQDLTRNDWVLNIDADETVPRALVQELAIRWNDLSPTTVAFETPRKTLYLGKWIQHGGWYPNYLIRLARKSHARWSEPSVHERLVVQGPVVRLREPLYHNAFRSIDEQIKTNLRFARLGSEDLLRKGQKPSLLKLLLKPLGKFIETYFLKAGFLDGLRGFIISINAAHSMFLKQAFLHEVSLNNENSDR